MQSVHATNVGPLAGMAKSRMNCAAPFMLLYVVFSAVPMLARGSATTLVGRSTLSRWARIFRPQLAPASAA